MIIEMVVVGMGIQAAYLDHMVGVVVVEEHITTEEIALAMRGRILVMMLLRGVQIPRMGMMVWANFQVQRSRTHLEGKLSLVVGVLVEVGVEVVAVAGAVELAPVEMMHGAVLLIMGLQDGVLTPRKKVPVMEIWDGVLNRKEVPSLSLETDGLELTEVAVGEGDNYIL